MSHLPVKGYKYAAYGKENIDNSGIRSSGGTQDHEVMRASPDTGLIAKVALKL